jgi:NAD(P)-dependent dehydrogenase (short-subunit alcohol dehydrogenase family)
MAREIALIVGVGPGLGAALARCFASAGFDVALAARQAGKLASLGKTLSATGVRARSYACDVGREADVDGLFGAVARDLGEPHVVVFNAGAFVKKGILESTAAELERCWRVACLGGFMVGQRAARIMVKRAETIDAPGGTVVFTGATASMRGGAQFHNLAVPKMGLRALAQSMARELGPRGVHVAHVIIDGQIMGERHAHLAKERPPDGLLSPDAIAANYLMLHRQSRSAWTFELDLRPWVERF